jgi:hypothetical protein
VRKPYTSEGEVARLELEQSEANAAEASKRAGLELPEHADRLLTHMQARLDELLLSRDQQIGQLEKELSNVRAKLEANESELEAVRLRLTDAEKGWTKSKAEADTLRAQTATGSLNRDEDRVARRLMERVQAMEVRMALMECRCCCNEG